MTLGIRPAHLSLGAGGRPGIPARVEVIEPTGPVTIGILSTLGQEIVAALPPDTRLEEGAGIELGFDPGKLLVFDAVTGHRVGPV